MTVEEMHLARRVFGEALGLDQIGFRVPPTGEPQADNILLTADRNPNTAGAAALEIESGAGSDGILQGLRSGKIRAMIVWRHDLAGAEGGEELLAALDGLDFLAWAGTNDNPTGQQADVVLPLAAWVERSGSFVNTDGRLQTFEAAMDPPGSALPDAEVLLAIADAAGVAFPRQDPAGILQELAAEGEPLAGADTTAARNLGHAWDINGGETRSPLIGSPLSEDEVEEG
jgi:formate dehydrogenase major subunit